MKFTAAITALVLSFSGHTTSAQAPAPGEDEPNIVGGNQAPPGKFPWYTIVNRDSAACGGALIEPQWVLTSARCFGDFDFYGSVRIGTERITNTQDGTVVAISKLIQHPEYNSNSMRNDIMLVKLTEGVGINPIALETSSSTGVPSNGLALTVMGFGATSFQGPTSNVLMEADVDKVSHGQCSGQYGSNVIQENIMFCAARAGNDSCTGDSGSPVIDKQTNVQVGIVSFGEGCANPSYSGVYTRVGYFSGWIQDTINSNGGPGTAPSPGGGGSGGGGGGKASSRRRMLESSPSARSLQQDDGDYHKYLEQCGHLEYDVSLYVDPDTHLYLVGVPKDKDAASVAQCPLLGAVHARMSDHDKATKEIVFWKNYGFDDMDEDGVPMLFDKDNLFHVGPFQLRDMARAYETVEPDNGNNSATAFYDVVTNNCGSFLVNLAKEMNVKIDARMTSFVARRLLENSGKDLVDKVRNSLGFKSLFGDSRNLRALSSKTEASNQDIVGLLVQKTVVGAN